MWRETKKVASGAATIYIHIASRSPRTSREKEERKHGLATGCFETVRKKLKADTVYLKEPSIRRAYRCEIKAASGAMIYIHAARSRP